MKTKLLGRLPRACVLALIAASGLALFACSGRFSSCQVSRACELSSGDSAEGGGSTGGEAGVAAAPSGGAEVGGYPTAGGGGDGGKTLGNEASGAAGAAGDSSDPSCGNGRIDEGEECDQGAHNSPEAYGKGACTSQCKAAPYCGDKKRNGPEKCDQGGEGVELGACNPQCTGFYEKKYIRDTFTRYAAGALAGVAGADAKCVAEFGEGWKALIVGGGRRATKTPFAGDAANDWVIHEYTHYYSYFENKLLWRTDDVALLGVRDGARVNLYADAFKANGEYPWSGWRADWTTFDDDVNNQGTCAGWTSTTSEWASFAFADLMPAASESCSTASFLLCVEQ